MDCLLATESCKDLCSLKCCQSLVCHVEDGPLQKAFWEQSNYYRKMIGLTCPTYSACQTRAQFFSEQLTTSPIYNPDCDTLHKTTIMTDPCKRAIINYCSSDSVIDDKETCTSFLNTGVLFSMHDWNAECDDELLSTKYSQFPNVSNICYEYILNQCGDNECGCFLAKTKSADQVQLIPCLLTTWNYEINVDALNIIVILLLFILLCYNAIILSHQARQ
jgi:hypothetical protein